MRFAFALALLLLPATVQAQQKPADPTANGDTLFATSCGWCHADGGRAPGKGPRLAGITKDDDFIRHRIKNGYPGQMPAFGRTFNDAQIDRIIAYIRTLKPE